MILGKGTCGGIDTQNKFNPERISDDDKKRLKRQLQISDSDIVIGFCGRLVKDKGVIELVEGFKLLKEKYPHLSFKLLVVGPLEKRDSIPLELVEYMRSFSRYRFYRLCRWKYGVILFYNVFADTSIL